MYVPVPMEIQRAHALEHAAMRRSGVGMQGLYGRGLGAQVDLVRFGALGRVVEGQDVPDDLIAEAQDRGGVIVSWERAIASELPPERVLVAQVVGEGPSYAVITSQDALAFRIPIFFDPLLASGETGESSPMWPWVVGVGALVVVGAGVWAWSR